MLIPLNSSTILLFQIQSSIIINNDMSIPILLSSALRAAASQSFNLSIIEAICRSHVFQQKCDVKDINKIWNEILGQYTYKSKKIADWLNVFLFNVCAINQQCISQRENRMLQSTQEARVSSNFNAKKQQQQLSDCEAIRSKLRVWLEFMLNLPFFDKMFTQMGANSISKNRSLRYLYETIDYLINKYQLNCRFKTKIAQLIENVSQSSVSEAENQIGVVNKKIFGSGQKLSRFFQDIEDNYSLEIKEIAELISINYIELQPPRKIFTTTQLTGKDLTEEIVDHIIRKVNKTDLFSEKMENFRPYELLVNIIFQKNAAAIAEWNCFLLPFLESFGQKKMYSLQTEQVYQKFGTFLSVFIPSDYPYLHNILKYIYSTLLAKYSSSDSFQLMKKFVLNRLFLNPHYFSQLIQPNEVQVMQYVKFANSLRVLFYQKKVVALIQSQKNPRIQQVSELLLSSLKNMLGGKQGHIQGFNLKDRGVYVNDKLVTKLINKIGDNFAGFAHQSSHKSKISAQSQSQLSFSLRNQSISRLGNLSSHQNVGMANNSSLPHLPKPHQKVSFSRKEQQKKPSEADQKQMSANTFPIESLEELVALRKQYGQLKRQISSRCYSKRERNSQKMQILYNLNQGANDLRGQLVKDMNKVIMNSLFF